MKRDPLVFGALAAVLVVLASAEYELARACGFGKYVAAGVPAALDIYAIKALRSKRDVLLVVAALIAVNAASHLVASGLLPVDWPLIVAVSAIAPLVLWRVHRLSEDPATPAPEPQSEPVHAAPEPAEPAPEPITLERAPEPADEPGKVPIFGEFVPVAELLAGTSGTSLDQHALDALKVTGTAPEPTPEPLRATGSDLESEDTADTRFDRYVEDARAWLIADPALTGTAIGTKLGTSDAYGRRVRRAALAQLART